MNTFTEYSVTRELNPATSPKVTTYDITMTIKMLFDHLASQDLDLAVADLSTLKVEYLIVPLAIRARIYARTPYSVDSLLTGWT